MYHHRNVRWDEQLCEVCIVLFRDSSSAMLTSISAHYSFEYLPFFPAISSLSYKSVEKKHSLTT